MICLLITIFLYLQIFTKKYVFKIKIFLYLINLQKITSFFIKIYIANKIKK